MTDKNSKENIPVIVLMTDFGEQDFFVGSMKGVILKINSQAKVVDLTNALPSFNVRVADFVLSNCYRYFPKGTIFVIVVDPGVGSKRKILLVKTRDYFFLAPDNGVLTSVLKQTSFLQIFSVENSKYFLNKISSTFHGRDVFAPVAAWLSRGTPCEEFGPSISTYQTLKVALPRQSAGEIEGEIIYIDKFGNAITNIPLEMVKNLIQEKKLILKIKEMEIPVNFYESYTQGEEGEVFLIIGSLYYLEIACNQISLAKKLNLTLGEKFKVSKWK